MERRLQILRDTLAREERDLEKLVKSIRDQRHALLEAQALESELRQKVRSIRGVEAPLAPLQQHGSVLLEKLRPLLPSIKGFLSETSENSVFVSRDQGMVPQPPLTILRLLTKLMMCWLLKKVMIQRVVLLKPRTCWRKIWMKNLLDKRHQRWNIPSSAISLLLQQQQERREALTKDERGPRNLFNLLSVDPSSLPSRRRYLILRLQSRV